MKTFQHHEALVALLDYILGWRSLKLPLPGYRYKTPKKCVSSQQHLMYFHGCTSELSVFGLLLLGRLGSLLSLLVSPKPGGRGGGRGRRRGRAAGTGPGDDAGELPAGRARRGADDGG